MRVKYINGEIEDDVQLFGAGRVGKEVSYMLEKCGVHISCIIDNDKSKVGQKIWEKIICISLECANKDMPIVLCFENKDIEKNVYLQCKEEGFDHVYSVEIRELRDEIERLTDREYLTLYYYLHIGKVPNLERPKTLNEKLQWIKLHNRKPLLIQLGDKYRVRDYLREKFGEEYLIPLLYVTYDPDTLTKENLPKEGYALKSNCSCGDVEIIREGDAVDYTALREKFRKICGSDYSREAREWWYSQMRPCVIAEKLLLTKDGKIPNDYKLNYMNGKLQFIYCSIDREGLNYRKIYSPEWEELPFLWDGKRAPDKNLPNIMPPNSIGLMMKMGSVIAQDLDYVRVDYYDVEGKLYFGEITICHGAGFDRFIPEKYDEIYGEKLSLPFQKGENISNYLERFNPYNTSLYNVWNENLIHDEELLKLDWNESTIQPSPQVIKRVEELTIDASIYKYYPNTNNEILTKKIADYVGVNETNIIIFPSSDTAHEKIASVWIRRDDVCGIIWPTYDNFRATMELSDAEVKYFNMPGYCFDISVLSRYINETNPKMVYLCNPNNPTGEMVEKKIIKGLLEKYQNVLWIIDEAYGEFAGESVCDFVYEYANLIISKTFSKAFGLANFRIGYLVSAEDNIRLLSYVRNAKNMSSLSQEAALAALEDVEYMKKYVKDVNNAKAFLINELKGLKYIRNIFDSKGNYLMIELSSGRAKKQLIEYLHGKKILVRDLSQTFDLKEKYIRVTIGTLNQMKKVVNVMKDFNSMFAEEKL